MCCAAATRLADWITAWTSRCTAVKVAGECKGQVTIQIYSGLCVHGNVAKCVLASTLLQSAARVYVYMKETDLSCKYSGFEVRNATASQLILHRHQPGTQHTSTQSQNSTITQRYDHTTRITTQITKNMQRNNHTTQHDTRLVQKRNRDHANNIHLNSTHLAATIIHYFISAPTLGMSTVITVL